MKGYKITIPVPEGVPNDVKETLIDGMTNQFGGCSITEGRGTYVRDDGTIDDESVTYVSACFDGSRGTAEAHARLFASDVQRCSEEECVMWEVTEVTYGFE